MPATLAVLCAFGYMHQPRCQRCQMTRPRLAVLMSEEEKPNLAQRLGDIADASWDMFVMPGEAANSRYDRPLQPLESNASAVRKNTTFAWGGGSDEQKALRLPTGVRAAERLTPAPVERPRGLWFEVDGRDIKGDIEVLSREWTRLWAVCVVVALS